MDDVVTAAPFEDYDYTASSGNSILLHRKEFPLEEIINVREGFRLVFVGTVCMDTPREHWRVLLRRKDAPPL